MGQTMITIEQVEALVAEIETEESARRTKLLRLIRGEARIAWSRAPQAFPARALRYQDEDGHWDSSYPPKQVYCDRRGPRLAKIVESEDRDIATSGGCYHTWRRVTEDPGLYVSRDGRLYGRTQEGTGAVGQYAAHPGDHQVDVDVTWNELDADDVPIARLEEAERVLRALAFPASVAA